MMKLRLSKSNILPRSHTSYLIDSVGKSGRIKKGSPNLQPFNYACVGQIQVA